MLLRNSIWNLTGLALPTLVALATVPILIHYLGLEGFGVITLIGSVVGYFGVLDLNLTAGSIKYLSLIHI
jgi:O-antigen/teichoic acid export membrane protein